MTVVHHNPTRAALHGALAAAIRAPSPHNTQPWLFEISPARIDLLLDERRVLRVADPDGREARLACGAALFNIRIALRAAARTSVVDLLPDLARPELLATVWIRGLRAPSPQVQRLADAIKRRRTNRRPFSEQPVPEPTHKTMQHAADLEGARLALLTEPSRFDALAALLRQADHIQTQDFAYRAELSRWTVDSPRRQDGVPAVAGGPRPAVEGLLALRRLFDVPAVAPRPYEQQPLVAVLATPGDTRRDQVRAGQAMQRVLLTATSAGLSASFLSQPVEVPETRVALHALLGGVWNPQTVLRIGYGHAAPSTPRRPVHDVTRTAPTSIQEAHNDR